MMMSVQVSGSDSHKDSNTIWCEFVFVFCFVFCEGKDHVLGFIVTRQLLYHRSGSVPTSI